MNKLYVFDSGVIGSFYNYISSSKPIRDIYGIELCFCDENLVEFLNVKTIDSIDFFYIKYQLSLYTYFIKIFG